MPSLAENLRRIRMDRHLSQSALARASGVSQQLISQLERGKTTSTKGLPALAKTLGVSVHQIDERFRSDEGALSPDEHDLLDHYRQAGTRQRALVRLVLDELATRRRRRTIRGKH